MPNPNTGPFSSIAGLAGAPVSAAGVVAVSSASLGAPAASLDITGLDSTSRYWLLVLSLLQPVDASTPEALLNIAGAFQTADYQWKCDISRADNSTYAGSNSANSTQIAIGANNIWQNAAGRAGQMSILIHNPAQTSDRKAIMFEGSWWNITPTLAFVDGRGAYNGANGALTAIRIRMSSGNIATGLVADLYKYNTP